MSCIETAVSRPDFVPECLLRHQRSFVETRQDEFELAGIAVDVADREQSRHRSFEFLRVHRNQILMQIDPPGRHGPELHRQTEERKERVCGNRNIALGSFDLDR